MTVDLLLLGYLTIVSIVAVVRASSRPGWWLVLVAHALFVLLLFLLTRPRLGRVGRTLREIYPLLLLLGLYSELDVLNSGAVHDQVVQRWELLVFGTQISRQWWQLAPSTFWSTLLHGAYLSYYFIVSAPALYFAWRGELQAVDSLRPGDVSPVIETAFGYHIIRRPPLAEVRDSRGLVFVPPFDDPVIIAGAGTIGLEILEDLPDVDRVVREMERGMGDDAPPIPDALDAPGGTVERMRAFADAAREFYQAAPWQHLSEEDLVHVEAPAVGSGLRYFTVLGAAGQTFGLGFFTNPQEFDAVHEDPDPEAFLSRRGKWTVLYGPIDEMPFGDVSPRVVLAGVAMGVHAAPGAFGVIVDGSDHCIGEARFVVGGHEPAIGLARADVDEAGWATAERADYGQLTGHRLQIDQAERLVG